MIIKGTFDSEDKQYFLIKKKNFTYEIGRTTYLIGDLTNTITILLQRYSAPKSDIEFVGTFTPSNGYDYIVSIYKIRSTFDSSLIDPMNELHIADWNIIRFVEETSTIQLTDKKILKTYSLTK